MTLRKQTREAEAEAVRAAALAQLRLLVAEGPVSEGPAPGLDHARAEVMETGSWFRLVFEARNRVWVVVGAEVEG